ncbi:MAG: segregation/condensation protein A, partial [Hadesarchaea archaeon]|nr:segregation/condensation protein A [Hadesarchaea archaeon]
MGVVVDQPFQILLELVQAHKLDPWDVDIEKLTDVFLRRMRELHELDIRVSARALLSASILLRIKSDRMLNGDGHGQVVEEEIEEVLDIDLPELGPVLMIQRAPHMITLADLLSGLREALREVPAGAKPARRE